MHYDEQFGSRKHYRRLQSLETHIVMTLLKLFIPFVVLASSVSAQQDWQRYTQPTGLSAEFPGEPERFDKWTDIAQGRVIELSRFMRETGEYGYDEMRAFYFLQAVIADKPYNIETEIKQQIVQAKGGGDAAVDKEFIGQRELKPSEMPLPGMRGIELSYRYTGFMGSSSQIEISRNMYLGNKWLSVSVRHIENDNRWPRDRFFKSVMWKP